MGKIDLVLRSHNPFGQRRNRGFYRAQQKRPLGTRLVHAWLDSCQVVALFEPVFLLIIIIMYSAKLNQVLYRLFPVSEVVRERES